MRLLPGRFLFCSLLLISLEAAEPAARPKQDANGNPIRYAATGHVSNYDEAKVGAYTLPDPLVLRNGERVRDAATWVARRRPEIVELYETEIFGRVPATAPRVVFSMVSTDGAALEGRAVRRHLVGRFGEAADGPAVNVVLYLPARATGPVPVLFHLLFGVPPGIPMPEVPAAKKDGKAVPPRPALPEAGPIAEILGRGYGYGMARYTEIEGDRADTHLNGVRRLALRAGQDKPTAGEWGTIAAWSWGVSRIFDQLAKEPGVDPQRLGLIGHSRLGKTALWAGACDERIGVIFSSCSGEMGAALARRDYGESVDDMAANFPWQFAGNFQKYAGRWHEMPVDSHLVIALAAPRPVFVTGGTQDQWADPHGEFLALVAAGPVYRLLGRKDVGAERLPALDLPLVAGDLGFLYHTGGHTITSADWATFLDFAGKAFLRAGR